jgi:arylsulfatase A-like enzyme
MSEEKSGNTLVFFISDNGTPRSSNRHYCVEFESARETGRAIRNHQYKLIEYSAAEQALYDLQNDPLDNSELISSGGDYSAILSGVAD